MKYLYILLLVVAMACNQYGIDPVAHQKLSTVQVTPLAWVSQEVSNLEDGMFKASLGGQEVQVIVEDGNMKWMTPSLEDGEYTLTLEQGGLFYTVDVHVVATTVGAPASYIEQVSKELGLGIESSDIQALTQDQQAELAQFFASNKERIKEEKNSYQEADKNATSPFYYRMDVGESVTFDVVASEYWNGSGIYAEAGQAFEVTASGTWKDWYIGTDANGYNSWQLALFTLLRRSPSEPWFKLIAATSQDKLYTVGSGAIIRTEAGTLDFFANDAPGFYWNNYGSITVTVTRVE